MYRSKAKLPNGLTNKEAFSAASDIAYGGKSLPIIADELGISVMQVRYHLLGKKMRRKTYCSQSGWFQKYKHCLPLDDMYQALKSRFRRSGQKKNKNQSSKKIKFAKQKKRALRVLADYEKYKKLAPVAKKYNITDGQVSRIVRGLSHKEIYDYFHRNINVKKEALNG